MARKSMKRSKLYKEVHVETKNMGSAGDQILLGRIQKIDAQGITGFVNNLMLTGFANEAEQDNIAVLFYLTTDNTWSDSYVISARSTAVGGGTVSLPAKRRIARNDDDPNANDGLLYLWAEVSDTIASEEMRYIVELWGRYVEYIAL